ncbi:MAG: hypothetical protein LBL62_10990 [Planctomycetaceae bacterium]|nr:hypothetical protein [Planctomycetaceae bacterium]
MIIRERLQTYNPTDNLAKRLPLRYIVCGFYDCSEHGKSRNFCLNIFRVLIIVSIMKEQ